MEMLQTCCSSQLDEGCEVLSGHSLSKISSGTTYPDVLGVTGSEMFGPTGRPAVLRGRNSLCGGSLSSMTIQKFHCARPSVRFHSPALVAAIDEAFQPDTSLPLPVGAEGGGVRRALQDGSGNISFLSFDFCSFSPILLYPNRFWGTLRCFQRCPQCV